MSAGATYPKRLIEVDLLIKRISEYARREKSIRHGHISTLHIWWARRPLAACRAVICASLWPDPADPLCPESFIAAARKEMLSWTSHEKQQLLSSESQKRFNAARKKPDFFDDRTELRRALLDFIADFASWDNSTIREYLDTSRVLTQAAHEALGGAPGTRPLVVDPFAGGGSIPLEALRVGADAFASDLNPVPVLLNKVVLEYIPKYGQRLVDEVRKWGAWIKSEAEKELSEFYPKDPDGATPITYLWARTIRCEGPGCGAEVPLIRSLWLAKKANRSVALKLVPNKKAKCVEFKIIVKQRVGWVNQDDKKEKVDDPKNDGTVKRGSATCPCCGYTTPVSSVRDQLKKQLGGANNATLTAVVVLREKETGRSYRTATQRDLQICKSAKNKLTQIELKNTNNLSRVPAETLPLMSGVFNAPIYGHTTWGSLFTHRQALSLVVLSELSSKIFDKVNNLPNKEIGTAAATILSLAISKHADLGNALCAWEAIAQCPRHLFGRQAIGMVWDFAEGVATSDSSGSALIGIDRTCDVLDELGANWLVGHAEQASASSHPLPDDIAQTVITDPPYYNAVPYADLSDFFYIWLRRILAKPFPSLFNSELAPKDDEICEMSGWDPLRYAHKTSRWFEDRMRSAMSEARRIVQPNGIGVIVFAHKSTAGWEAQLQAILDAGWVVTASWPIDTECGSRLRAIDSAALASSIHIVVRPRENLDGSVRTEEIGDWRDVLSELPARIHEWMPRLAEEGVVGADAIFACLGPALEVFSRYSRVEKADGTTVALKEYLEHVWAAVAKEALSVIFENASADGFEPEARLTAMWLWTLSAGGQTTVTGSEEEDKNEEDEDKKAAGKKKKMGYTLEFDAARKIAQGLGANLEVLDHLVEIDGGTARLLPVMERAKYLFGKSEEAESTLSKKKKKSNQQELFSAVNEEDGKADSKEDSSFSLGSTTLDRVHQSMLLFSAGRTGGLKRLLVDEGAGNDVKFWRLAQALSALYPAATDEKRWIDGVLARKKGLGF